MFLGGDIRRHTLDASCISAKESSPKNLLQYFGQVSYIQLPTFVVMCLELTFRGIIN